MKNVIQYVLYGISLFTLSSCATLFSGTSQHISIDSEPQGAEVSIDGQIIGTTPTTLRINRRPQDLGGYGRRVNLEKLGYRKQIYYIKTKVNPVAYFNLFSLLFWGIDYATGAIVRYNEYNYFELREDRESVSAKNLNKVPDNSQSKDKYQQLRELKKLLDEGILTEEEFQREKEEILNRNN
jgi:hypothetical protein